MSDLHSDSSVRGIPYAEIIDQMQALASGNELVRTGSMGQTVNGLPIQYLEIGRSTSSGSNRPLIMITDAIHGNEFQDMGRRIATHFARNSNTEYFQRGGSLIVVPVMNPDGYEYHRNLNGRKEAGPDGGNSWGRMNARRKDLNRDFSVPSANFTGFTQPETQAFQRFLGQKIGEGHKLQLSVDYHCCMGPGTLLYPYAYSRQMRPSTQQKQILDSFGRLFQTRISGIQAGSEYLTYDAQGVSMDYILDQYRAAAFVYEAALGRERQREASHFSAFADAMDQLADGLSAPPTTNNSNVIANQAPNDSLQPTPSTTTTLTGPFDPSSDIYAKVIDSNQDAISLAVSAEAGDRAYICTGSLVGCEGRAQTITRGQSLMNGRVLFILDQTTYRVQENQNYVLVVEDRGDTSATMVEFRSL